MVVGCGPCVNGGMTKRILKLMMGVVGGVAVLAGGFLAYVQVTGIPRYAPPTANLASLKVEVTPERVERGRKFAGVLCAGCHMDPTTKQLTGKRMEDAPAEFGVLVSKNITRHPTKGIGAWTDGELLYLLRTGVRKDGQYIPPYMAKLPHLSDEDLYSIIAFLRSDDPMVTASDVDPPGVTQPSFLVKFLSHVAFKPLPYPTQAIAAPPRENPVAYGRYLVTSLDCYGCHSADFKTMDVFEPEKTPGYFGGGNRLNNLYGGHIVTANLTPHETGIGKWTEADFVRALKTGFRPDGNVLRYPMVPHTELEDWEAAAIYAYLRTVPPIQNAVARVYDTTNDPDHGKRLFYKYSCVTCHGTDGVGIADLRGAAQRYTTDEQLVAWIRNAPGLKPGTKMPRWEGVIAEKEYAPLAAYVRKLGTVPAQAGTTAP